MSINEPLEPERRTAEKAVPNGWVLIGVTRVPNRRYIVEAACLRRKNRTLSGASSSFEEALAELIEKVNRFDMIEARLAEN